MIYAESGKTLPRGAGTIVLDEVGEIPSPGEAGTTLHDGVGEISSPGEAGTIFLDEVGRKPSPKGADTVLGVQGSTTAGTTSGNGRMVVEIASPLEMNAHCDKDAIYRQMLLIPSVTHDVSSVVKARKKRLKIIPPST